MPKKKSVVVDRRFLNDLADEIYDPKTRRFLRLCVGTLQNGPDPTDDERPMHCGLGELYFAMTGHHPKEDKVSEDDVVALAVKLSTLPDEEAELRRKEKELAAAKSRAKAVVKALKLPEQLQAQVEHVLDGFRGEDEPEEDGELLEDQFRDVLDDIPSQNDDACGDACTYDRFRKRSQRVASSLRAAARLLPA